jgi:hypothetical protein
VQTLEKPQGWRASPALQNFEATAAGLAVLGLRDLTVRAKDLLCLAAPINAAAGRGDIERLARVNEHLLAAQAAAILNRNRENG